ncbi:MAG: DNA primase [Gammaproteobacteria bacterium]
MSGRIPNEFIGDLLLRVDIVDLIDSFVPLKKTGSNFVARCPFHTEKTPSFTVNRQKQFFYCFGCGASGNAIGFLMDFNHLDFVEAVEDLASFVGVTVPAVSFEAHSRLKSDNTADLYRVMELAAVFYAKQLKTSPDAIAYLKARGISGEAAKTFLLGYAPQAWSELKSRFDEKTLAAAGLLVTRDSGTSYDRFRGRLMFPIRDKRGRVVAFGARVLDDSLPKYLNSPETPIFSKGREVYGLYELLQKKAKPERILLVEGYMDVVALVQHDIHFAVASLGTATSKAHLELLFRYTSEVALCFDGDKPGQEAAWRAMEPAFPCLKDGRRIKIMLLPEGHDPDSLIRTEGADVFRARIDAASTLSDFFFGRLIAKNNVDTLEGRAQLLHESRKYLEKLPSGDFRSMMFFELEALVGRNKLDDSENEAKLHNERSVLRRPKEKQRLSLAQFIIALLLQNPETISVIERKEIDWEEMEFSGYGAFRQVVGLLCEKMPENTAVAIEMFRGSKEEKWIKKLAFSDLSLPDDGIEEELVDAVDRLTRQARKEGIARMLSKKNSDGLTPEEQIKLGSMLAKR